jgi:uncharacterized phage protein (TIGR01671 family)
MRQLKFRAWDSYAEQMYFGGLELLLTMGVLNIKHRSWQTQQKDSVRLLQYTGLKDKNGKEIYEGDVVKTSYKTAYGKLDVVERVIFGGAAFYPVSTRPGDTWEVIGNIYENPELLKSAHDNPPHDGEQ